jgi:two-component system, chemotaxis family, sensor kinase CheA
MQDGDNSFRESMLEVFLFETTQMVEQLEELLIDIEEQENLSDTAVNEIFRIMHTIKGSSAMMMYDGISKLAHSLEDLFAVLRTERTRTVDCHRLADIVLQTVDFIKAEMQKIERNVEPDGDSSALTVEIKGFLTQSPDSGDASVKKQSTTKAKSQEKTTVASKGNASAGMPDTAEKKERLDFGSSPVLAGDEADTGSTSSDEVRFFAATAYFEAGCEMENMRAYTLVHQLEAIASSLQYDPANILEDESTAEAIRANGFYIEFTSDKSLDELNEHFTHTLFLERIDVVQLESEESRLLHRAENTGDAATSTDARSFEGEGSDEPDNGTASVRNAGDSLDRPDRSSDASVDRSADVATTEPSITTDAASAMKNSNQNAPTMKQSIISVNVKKMDLLMDLVGELVIAEAMVTKNPDLEGLALENFSKASRQLNKLTGELQDVVMSMRLIPIANTFQKMQRLVRDIKRKLDKEVDLVLIGEETEIDKNITELLSDPLMHIIRNAMDHGIEDRATRIESGKSESGTITLEAKNSGGDIWITVRDDGKGLDKEVLYNKAKKQGLVTKDISEYTEKEIHSLIMLPGFSTKDKVTEFSGRGVGMDVVRENISKLGGSIMIESKLGFGTVMRIRIPMTLAIIDGMVVAIGREKYIIPTTTIRESFRAVESQVVRDTEGNEMLMIRGECYRVLRLHEHLKIQPDRMDLTAGIIVVIEEEGQFLCLFADDLIGKQQVVVKPIPSYLKKSKSLAGCTILGDGSISLILDAKGLIQPGQ